MLRRIVWQKTHRQMLVTLADAIGYGPLRLRLPCNWRDDTGDYTVDCGLRWRWPAAASSALCAVRLDPVASILLPSDVWGSTAIVLLRAWTERNASYVRRRSCHSHAMYCITNQYYKCQQMNRLQSLFFIEICGRCSPNAFLLSWIRDIIILYHGS